MELLWAVSIIANHPEGIKTMDNLTFTPNIGEVAVDLGDLRIAYDPLTDECIRRVNVTPIESVEYPSGHKYPVGDKQHWTIIVPNHNP